MNSTITIVMLSWNRRNDVRESLNRIRQIQYSPIEVIIVDNASSDETPEMISNEFPEVQLIALSENIGIEAYNKGFEAAKGKYIVIIDDDSFPAFDAINKMVERFEEDPLLGAVAFDVRNFYHYDEVSVTTAVQAQTEAISSQYFMSFNGAGVGIRAELFREIGYYPGEFFLYNNEMDTAFRIWDKGYHIKFFSDIVSYHKYSPVNRTSWRAPFYYTRNAFWLVWKYYKFGKCLKTTLLLIYLCICNSIEQRTTVYLKAMFSAFKDIDKLKGKRKPVNSVIADGLRVPFDTFFTFYR
ncbi:glycosyltransferase family 2 protein [Paenibacillus yanchengensis]|uniref:Glycosyltransferase family 2 protein n=1 Tax=Paenibacillus yanchengensis TaxID=2035833 RepID=A0ABW4YMS8_9BACL